MGRGATLLRWCAVVVVVVVFAAATAVLSELSMAWSCCTTTSTSMSVWWALACCCGCVEWPIRAAAERTDAAVRSWEAEEKGQLSCCMVTKEGGERHSESKFVW